MSAEWALQSGESWKVSLPCTRAEAAALAVGEPDFSDIDPPPVLMTSEPDPADEEHWRLDAYLGSEPDAALLARIGALVPSAADIAPTIERIEDADWVTMSQAWLEPIRTGRFHVHTAAHAADAPAGMISFHIEAGRAFGTGHHETTSGCLLMLDRLETGGASFRRIADIGTGTGLLAFAARALWPRAAIVAADIDPISIEVTATNMAANAIPAGGIVLVVADGVNHPKLLARVPFDLIIANILAGPLIELAPSFAASAAPVATIVLAGLLASQEADVLGAYAACGFAVAERIVRGDWSILALVRRAETGLEPGDVLI